MSLQCSCFQVFVNVGMTIEILPITGVTLPLMSYGGSSVLTTLLAVGLLQSIYRRRARPEIEGPRAPLMKEISTERSARTTQNTRAAGPVIDRPLAESTPALGARPVRIPKEWKTVKKQVLVSVDRAETRVALLEAEGAPAPARSSGSGKTAQSCGQIGSQSGRRRGGGDCLQTRPAEPAAGYRIAELYIERRGARSIVGNIYNGRSYNVLRGLEAAFVDIGLDKNGFLHVDEIVLPGVEAPRRGRGTGTTRKIADLLSSPARRSSCRSSRTR